jgi:hypothetical protein
MDENKKLSDQYLEHCLTATPTLENVKTFLCSDGLGIYWRYRFSEEEERREEERILKKYRRIGRFEAKVEFITNSLLSTSLSIERIAEMAQVKLQFVENIKSKLSI